MKVRGRVPVNFTQAGGGLDLGHRLQYADPCSKQTNPPLHFLVDKPSSLSLPSSALYSRLFGFLHSSGKPLCFSKPMLWEHRGNLVSFGPCLIWLWTPGICKSLERNSNNTPVLSWRRLQAGGESGQMSSVFSAEISSLTGRRQGGRNQETVPPILGSDLWKNLREGDKKKNLNFYWINPDTIKHWKTKQNWCPGKVWQLTVKHKCTIEYWSG